MGACVRGWGVTKRRGAGATDGAAATGALASAAGLAATTGPAPLNGFTAAALAATGAVATTAGRGGVLRACSAAAFRSRIAFIASPGLEMLDRLKAGLASACGFVAAPPARLPFR